MKIGKTFAPTERESSFSKNKDIYSKMWLWWDRKWSGHCEVWDVHKGSPFI